MNKVSKSYRVQKSNECRLRICCLMENIEENHSRTNKHKVRMLSSQISFAPTSGLRERLSQIHKARQASLVATDSLARHLVFSYVIILILNSSSYLTPQINSENFEKNQTSFFSIPLHVLFKPLTLIPSSIFSNKLPNIQSNSGLKIHHIALLDLFLSFLHQMISKLLLQGGESPSAFVHLTKWDSREISQL